MAVTRFRRPHAPRQLPIWLAIGGLCAFFIAAIVAFPLATQGLIANDRDWKTLSDAGQAYGGISAIVAGLGFCGIAASLALQTRQTKLTQAISARERHFELVKLALEYPELSYQIRDDQPDLYKRKVIINLWVSHWLLLWDIGEADEDFVHFAFTDLFRDEIARDWWQEWGGNWGTRDTRQHRRFMRIAWDCHARASKSTTEELATGPRKELIVDSGDPNELSGSNP